MDNIERIVTEISAVLERNIKSCADIAQQVEMRMDIAEALNRVVVSDLLINRYEIDDPPGKIR